ncbi:class I SAM-dependent methyltransferase [Gracilibacillus oryzae]|uniref:Class I SAM-dependent methyltransferase n=1 Tax=Gracilibacillus oryzae TaxID=1672701 RepID=A0A7C8KQ43_9BACI|nr:class I SAM-dependent methyltransferase [Gracilibacillus oryzae]KAB8127281.1 class I SAM-dependent methyltransferase [Gracilibacillus oryzae]
MAYSKLAYVYDVLMEDAPYDDWQAFVYEIMRKHCPHAVRLLDLGCGTGEMSIRLAKNGMDVTGVDFSEDMLSYAQSAMKEAGVQIDYIKQDIRKLDGLAGFDLIISLCDVINYVTDTVDLQKVFQNVSNALNPGGIFIFDVHSLNHFEKNMVNQTFAEIYDDISYVWFCEEGDRDGELFHDLTFFIQNEEGALYERFDETHHQRTFSVAAYRQFLEQSGLNVLDIYADFSIIPSKDPEAEAGNRIFFVCQK